MVVLFKTFDLLCLALSASGLGLSAHRLPRGNFDNQHRDISARSNVDSEPSPRFEVLSERSLPEVPKRLLRRRGEKCVSDEPSAEGFATSISAVPVEGAGSLFDNTNVSASPPSAQPTADPAFSPAPATNEDSSSSSTDGMSQSESSFAPTPTQSQEPASTTDTGVTPSSSSAPSDSGTYSGDATFYNTGLGSCGITNVDTDFIAAIAEGMYDSFPGYNGANPNDNPICGKRVVAMYEGKQVEVTITDRCGGCQGASLDFSPSAFQELADPSIGRLYGMTWSYVE